MKRFMLLLAAVSALGLNACSSIPNKKVNYVPPSTSAVRASVDTARGHADRTSTSLSAAAAKAKTATERIVVIEKAVADNPPILILAQELHGDLDDLTRILLESQTENNALKVVLGTVPELITSLQKQVDGQTTLLNESNTQLNAAITQGAIDKRNAHRFKTIIIMIAAAAAVALMFGFFRFAAFAPPLLYATIGAPLAVSTFLYFWLGSG